MCASVMCAEVCLRAVRLDSLKKIATLYKSVLRGLVSIAFFSVGPINVCEREVD